jgi:hypothetical protein
MKRSVLTTAALTALVCLALVAADSQACGRRTSCCEIKTCCATVATTAPMAPARVETVEVKVTKYKQEMVTKEITEVVCRVVQKEVPYRYTVQVPVVTPTRQVVTVCKTVTREVPYKYTVLVPRTVQEKAMCVTYTCVTEAVTRTVPVCRTVRVPCVDACGNCTYVCQRVTEMQTVTCNVVKRVPVTKEVMVTRTICEPVVKDGKKLVCELVRENQEVTVNVCSYRAEVREGKRMVCEVVSEKVTRKVQVCQLTPYTETIRVPVAAPCSTSCGEPACGHARRSLFRRGCCE